MMEDNDFIQFVQDKINELKKQNIEDNKIARISMIISKNFKSKLMNFVENSTEEKINFTREMITLEESNYDLRQEMNDEMIQIVLSKGYGYIEKESTSNELVFQKVKKKS